MGLHRLVSHAGIHPDKATSSCASCACCRTRHQPSSPQRASSHWRTCPTQSSLHHPHLGNHLLHPLPTLPQHLRPRHRPRHQWDSAWQSRSQAPFHHHMRVGLGYLHYHQRNEDRHLLLLRRHPERSEGSPHLLLPWLLSLPLFVFRRHPDPGEQSLHHDHLLFRRHSDPERQPNGSESQYFVVACSHPWDQRNQSGNAEPQTTAPDAKLPNTRYLSPATDNEQRPQR